MINDINKNQNEVMKKISLILDDNRANLADSIANFKSITAKIDSGEGSLALLLNDKQLYTTLKDAGENINSVAAKDKQRRGDPWQTGKRSGNIQ